MSTFLERVAVERDEQINKHGFTPESDDEYNNDELALGACVYAMPHHEANTLHGSGFKLWRVLWPWQERPHAKNRKEALIKAGALLMAEYEHLERLEAKNADQSQSSSL